MTEDDLRGGSGSQDEKLDDEEKRSLASGVRADTCCCERTQPLRDGPVPFHRDRSIATLAHLKDRWLRAPRSSDSQIVAAANDKRRVY